MKTLFGLTTLAILIASPALAQSSAQELPSSTAVIVSGTYIGQDPDLRIRFELLRTAFSDYGS